MVTKKIAAPGSEPGAAGGQQDIAGGANINIVDNDDNTANHRCQAPSTLALWRALVRELEQSRPALVAEHHLYNAKPTLDGDTLRVELPAPSAAWLRRFTEARMRPMDLAAAAVGRPGLHITFSALRGGEDTPHVL